jgi:hypothetical protein
MKDILEEVSFTKRFLKSLGLLTDPAKDRKELVVRAKDMAEDVLRKNKIKFRFNKENSKSDFTGEELVWLNYHIQSGPFKKLLLRLKVNVSTGMGTASLWDGDTCKGYLAVDDLNKNYNVMKSVFVRKWKELEDLVGK